MKLTRKELHRLLDESRREEYSEGVNAEYWHAGYHLGVLGAITLEK